MRKIFTIVLFIVNSMVLNAYDFKAVNQDNVELCYRILTDSTVALTYESRDANNYNTLPSKLVIPSQVIHDEQSYTVIRIDDNTLEYSTNISKLHIPSTISFIAHSGIYTPSIEEYIIADENPFYCSLDGIIYTKDKTDLVQYPPHKQDSIYFIPNGVQTLQTTSFFNADYIYELQLPLSLKKVDGLAFYGQRLETIILQDSVQSIDSWAFSVCPSLKKLVLGNQLNSVPFMFLAHYQPILVECRTIIPPICAIDQTQSAYINQSTLLVPRKAVKEYQQAEGWKEFGNILPIEPPITETADGAIVSWIQNFSATGYIWHLYKDETHLQLVMSLSFDNTGHLTHIELGNMSSAPSQIPARMNADSEQESRYAEYYSFTISSLQPNTTYFYSRQSVADNEVIDEEIGSFTTTLSTSIMDIDEDNNQSNKVIHNGQFLIKRNGENYSILGQQIK